MPCLQISSVVNCMDCLAGCNVAGSFVSLMMGLTFGGLSGYGAYLSSKDSRNFWLLFCKHVVYVLISHLQVVVQPCESGIIILVYIVLHSDVDL